MFDAGGVYSPRSCWQLPVSKAFQRNRRGPGLTGDTGRSLSGQLSNVKMSEESPLQRTRWRVCGLYKYCAQASEAQAGLMWTGGPVESHSHSHEHEHEEDERFPAR